MSLLEAVVTIGGVAVMILAILFGYAIIVTDLEMRRLYTSLERQLGRPPTSEEVRAFRHAVPPARIARSK